MKRVISAILVIIITSTCGKFIEPAQAKYSGGSGASEDPYLISTAEDMNQIGRNYTDWDKYFKLIADINLSAYTGTQFSRIGIDAKHAFNGIFDGNGHIISGFTYMSENNDYIGIFGNIGTSGRIENVFLVDVNINGHNYIGGLAGNNEGIISNCYSTVIISGNFYVGGLLGQSSGDINNCYSTGTINGGNNSQYLGGLIGYKSSGTLSDCNSTGSVSGNSNIGGLVGYHSGNTNNCYSNSSVNGNSYVGGLLGQSSGDINNCYSTGTINGGDNSQYLGGLIGYNSAGIISYCNSTGTVSGGNYSYNLGGLMGQIDHSNINCCYSTSIVIGGYNSDYVGGLIGYVYNSGITDCYAAGDAAGDYDTGGLVGINDHGSIARCYSSGNISGYMFVGGLLGWNYDGMTINSFWNIETSGQSWSDGGTGKTTIEMKTQSTFTNAGWNLFCIWDIVENQTYPFFGKYDRGSGSPPDPYRISSKNNFLALITDSSWYNKYVILTSDIIAL